LEPTCCKWDRWSSIRRRGRFHDPQSRPAATVSNHWNCLCASCAFWWPSTVVQRGRQDAGGTGCWSLCSLL